MTTATIPSGSEPVLIDSSGWLEYLTEDSKAILFADYFEGDHAVLVPTIVLYEVRKILLLRKSKSDADVFVSQALRRRIVDLDETLALAAVQVAIRHRLAMADAIIYATAQAHGAQLVTSDTHFAGLPGAIIL